MTSPIADEPRFESLVVVLLGRAVVTRGIKGVGLRTQAGRQSIFAFQTPGDKDGCIRKMQSFLGTDANSFDHQLSELLDEFLANQAAMPREEFATIGLCGKQGQLCD